MVIVIPGTQGKYDSCLPPHSHRQSVAMHTDLDGQDGLLLLQLWQRCLAVTVMVFVTETITIIVTMMDMVQTPDWSLTQLRAQ